MKKYHNLVGGFFVEKYIAVRNMCFSDVLPVSEFGLSNKDGQENLDFEKCSTLVSNHLQSSNNLYRNNFFWRSKGPITKVKITLAKGRVLGFWKKFVSEIRRMFFGWRFWLTFFGPKPHHFSESISFFILFLKNQSASKKRCHISTAVSFLMQVISFWSVLCSQIFDSYTLRNGKVVGSRFTTAIETYQFISGAGPYLEARRSFETSKQKLGEISRSFWDRSTFSWKLEKEAS